MNSMEINLVKPAQVFDELKKWLAFPVAIDELPAHTYAALLNGELVAIAGLRLCEGPICLLDSLATNPTMSSSVRHEAIDLLVERIHDRAKELGFRAIVCHSKESSIISRAIRLGYAVVPEISLVRGLQ